MQNPRKDCVDSESRDGRGSALCFLCVFYDGKNYTISILSGIFFFFFGEYNMLDFSPLCRILEVLHFQSRQKFVEFCVNQCDIYAEFRYSLWEDLKIFSAKEATLAKNKVPCSGTSQILKKPSNTTKQQKNPTTNLLSYLGRNFCISKVVYGREQLSFHIQQTQTLILTVGLHNPYLYECSLSANPIKMVSTTR